MAGSPRPKRSALAGALALIALTAVVYVPALRDGFVWDDDAYVTANRALRSGAGLAEIWLRPGATPQYYPLTFTSFWLEWRLWGASPAGYHATNVALHAAAAVVLWRVLALLAIPGAWLGAAFFFTTLFIPRPKVIREVYPDAVRLSLSNLTDARSLGLEWPDDETGLWVGIYDLNRVSSLDTRFLIANTPDDHRIFLAVPHRGSQESAIRAYDLSAQ